MSKEMYKDLYIGCVLSIIPWFKKFLNSKWSGKYKLKQNHFIVKDIFIGGDKGRDIFLKFEGWCSWWEMGRVEELCQYFKIVSKEKKRSRI